MLNVLQRERKKLVDYFSHPKVTNKYYKTILVKSLNELAIVEPTEERVGVAIDEYAKKLKKEH